MHDLTTNNGDEIRDNLVLVAVIVKLLLMDLRVEMSSRFLEVGPDYLAIEYLPSWQSENVFAFE